MSQTWRLIDDPAADGVWNMGVDRAIQLAHSDGSVAMPTLRLYGWRRPTVTLGRFQSADVVDESARRELGVDIARRPTGGRGVLHADEITYAVVAGVSNGVPRGVAASYRALAEPLRAAFRELGISAHVLSRSGGCEGSPDCYLATSQADLAVGALKLSGSAQVWADGTVLQHGSFVMTRDLALEARLFSLDEAAASRLASHTLTLEDALGERPGPDVVRAAIVRGFERSLGIRFVEGSLSREERGSAEEMAGRYAVAADPTESATAVRGSSYA